MYGISSSSADDVEVSSWFQFSSSCGAAVDEAEHVILNRLVSRVMTAISGDTTTVSGRGLCTMELSSSSLSWRRLSIAGRPLETGSRTSSSRDGLHVISSLTLARWRRRRNKYIVPGLYCTEHIDMNINTLSMTEHHRTNRFRYIRHAQKQ